MSQTSRQRLLPMRIAAVSSVDMKIDPARASAEFSIKTNMLQAILLIGIAVTGLVCLLAPVLMIATDAITNPHVIHTLADNPGSTALLACGIVLGTGLLIYPLRAGLARLGGKATVRMADGMVTFESQGLLHRDVWRAPLAQFCGVTHHIRATLSGPRHEIILVHPDPSRDILLHVAPRHPKDDAAHYADLLGLGQLQPRTLYSRRRSRPIETVPVELQARGRLSAFGRRPKHSYPPCPAAATWLVHCNGIDRGKSICSIRRSRSKAQQERRFGVRSGRVQMMPRQDRLSRGQPT